MITTECCFTIFEQFVSTQLPLEDRPSANWFMHDAARPRRTDKVFRFLHEYFGNGVIVLDYPQFTDIGKAWPPYFPYLSPCDFFLWSALKDAVYRNNLTALDESLNSVAFDSISVEALQDMVSTFIVRLRHLIVSNGEHFEKIVL